MTVFSCRDMIKSATTDDAENMASIQLPMPGGRMVSVARLLNALYLV